ncbi:hypothetical protein SAMN04488038_102246 [Solimonas aquatica]|uniref:Uncharacterized protein n=1 Tax=Solimonas aquatica TaxID=489703 RepID=A0A1H9BXA6_9GAMM|nr:hypothetical protein SAMN04488038_102246 [Solimonas aquatica]
MTPIKQDKLFSPDGLVNGNAMAACLASLLDLPLWMVPPFEDMHGRGAATVDDRIKEWLQRMFGLTLELQGRHEPEDLPAFYIASGPSSRGAMHSVIYSNGVLAHDPHPAGDGIVEVSYCRFLKPVHGQP